MLGACLRGINSSWVVNKWDETNFASPSIPTASRTPMKEKQDGWVLSNYNSLDLVLQTSSVDSSGTWDYLFLALSSPSQSNIRLERNSRAFNTSHLPNISWADQIVLMMTRFCTTTMLFWILSTLIMKNLLWPNIFPVVFIWIIFFDLNNFSSPLSPPFSVMMC